MRPQSLSTTQREEIITEITDMRDATSNLKIDREGIRWVSNYESDDRIEDEEYLDALSDEGLIDFWYALVGEPFCELLAEEGELAREWEDADFEGVQTPANWQFEKLLNREERDYTIPSVVNIIRESFKNCSTVIVSDARLEYLLELYNMDVDADGFIIDAETRQWKEPYSFDAHGDRTFKLFRDLAHDSEDDPLIERLAKMREETGEHHLHWADRIHVEEFGGIIHPAVTPTGSCEILQDRFFDLTQLAAAGVLTSNIKAFSPPELVLTTAEKNRDMVDYASAVYEMDDANAESRSD
jgi:hypothetical protein